VVRGGQLAVATVMTVTLTCDHRVVDGAIGAKFLQAFKGLIEEPLAMLA
jgi:pyruvate dehydrogenase E2 component (dihydrolipoamide acetyltransferase)